LDLKHVLADAVARGEERIEIIEKLALQCARFADMEYAFL
jgi:hypothetical protein